MTRTVRLTDGVQFDLSSGERVVCDGERPAGDVNILSHAHGDHLFRRAEGPVVCSPLTAALARARGREGVVVERGDHPKVELVNAGHVPGSSAALVTDDDGTRFLYTGDCSTRDRFFLDGFEPPSADVLVVESTYGKPEYRFPPQAEAERRIVDWLDDERDRPVLLFGYSLGRAQQLQLLANRSSRSRLFVTRATARVNDVLEEHLDVDFGAERYGEDVELGAGDALVLPTRTSRLSFVDHIVDDTGAAKVGFSGWATDESFRYRGDYDVTFPLSDHCDFEELVDVVEAVDPETVYTTHGFDEAFADHLSRRLGYDARPLKRNQTALSEF